MWTDFLTVLGAVPVTIGRWLPYLLVLAVILVAAAIWLRGGKEQTRQGLAATLDRDYCQCPAGADDPHHPREHSSCADGLCGLCDTCVSARRLSGRNGNRNRSIHF